MYKYIAINSRLYNKRRGGSSHSVQQQVNVNSRAEQELSQSKNRTNSNSSQSSQTNSDVSIDNEEAQYSVSAISHNLNIVYKHNVQHDGQKAEIDVTENGVAGSHGQQHEIGADTNEEQETENGVGSVCTGYSKETENGADSNGGQVVENGVDTSEGQDTENSVYVSTSDEGYVSLQSVMSSHNDPILNVHSDRSIGTVHKECQTLRDQLESMRFENMKLRLEYTTEQGKLRSNLEEAKAELQSLQVNSFNT